MKRIILGLLVFCLLAEVVCAFSYTGSQGLLTLPTANMRRNGSGSIGLNYAENDISGALAATFLENLELGIAAGSRDPVYGFFKWRLSEETLDRPAFAVGASGSSFYAVLSKNLLPNGLKAHIGMGSGEYKGVFGGISYVVNPVSISPRKLPVPIVTLLLELKDNSREQEGSFVLNFGGRLQLNNYFSVDIGLLDMKTLAIGAYLTTAF